MWNPNEHSDDLNLRWCWLRATEWIRWPYFISQPVVPVMLLFWPWHAVIAIVLTCNLIWYFLIRPNFISLPAAEFGAYFVRLKWIACPAMAWYFYYAGRTATAALALLWPILMIVVPAIPIFNLLALVALPTSSIGPVQKRFMMALGYQSFDENDAGVLAGEP